LVSDRVSLAAGMPMLPSCRALSYGAAPWQLRQLTMVAPKTFDE
jgi:hypothetical protein